MGLRFYKRIRIAPGISLNLSKTGPSFLFGPRGMKYTVGPRGTRKTFGIPGTGLSYTTTSGWGTNRAGISPRSEEALPSLDIGFFGGMFIPSEDKPLVEGLKLFLSSKTDEAYSVFKTNSIHPDCLFMYGFTALGKGQYAESESAFLRCRQSKGGIGAVLTKYTKMFQLSLQITEFIDAPIAVDERGLTLSQIEAFQRQGKYLDAIKIASELWNRGPADLVVCLSLCDLIVANPTSTSSELDEVVQMTAQVENDGPLHANILYLRGAALYRMQLREGALAQLAAIARKKSGRPMGLLHQVRYLRGRLYEQANDLARARKEYELIYAEDAAFKDVRARIGIKP